jgi:predicted Fe-Mo cluster-binding NifX family protein
MRIAISATGNGMDAPVDPRFGRCAYLLFVDPEKGEIVEGGPNENADAAGGAGSWTARRVVEGGASVVLTGNVGPNAFEVLSAGGVRVMTGVSGSVRQAVEAYSRRELRESGSSTVARHAGEERPGRAGS